MLYNIRITLFILVSVVIDVIFNSESKNQITQTGNAKANQIIHDQTPHIIANLGGFVKRKTRHHN